MFSTLKKYFGDQVMISKIQEKLNLPYYLSNREMHKIEIDGVSFIVIQINTEDKFGVIALRKQQNVYIEHFQCNVAFSFDTVTKQQHDALIQHRIPFIALPEQVFLPFLGVILCNRFKKIKQINTEKMMPATQQLFLYLLYQKGKPILKSQAADALGLTRTSITRASEQLSAMDLIEQKKNGKEIHMFIKYPPEKTLQMAKPYLINPVQEKLTISKEQLPKEWLYAGESALGEYSMLNAPSVAEIAVYKNAVERRLINELDIRWTDGSIVVMIELWKYNPIPFSIEGKVDPVSLACSLMGSEDERVEMAIDEMLEVIEW